MKTATFKRRLLRKIPVLSDIARTLDALEAENREMRKRLSLPALLARDQYAEAMHSDAKQAAGSLPLPPAALRDWVAGTGDVDWFLESGQLGEQTIVSILARHNIEFDQLDAVLDFGCGCGRVMRHLNHYQAVRLHGTDANSGAVTWCDENLNFAEFGTNLLEPPTRYRPHSFDLVYAFSVFTHLPEPQQTPWMLEIRRILKPGGLLLVTLQGDFYLPQLPEPEKEKYQQGELVVQGVVFAGQTDCSAYHPEAYVREVLARGFEVVDFIPQGALGNPKQDAYLLRA
jgi:SAM-dependent methyltransferase